MFPQSHELIEPSDFRDTFNRLWRPRWNELAWLGIELDSAANTAGRSRISSVGSRVSAWCVPTDEERMIAGHTRTVLGLGRS
jgi:acetate kinase